MTLNSYRDPELRDRRSVFARYPLTTALGAVVGAFLLLVPVGLLAGRKDHVVVRTASLPGGVIEAMVVEPATTEPTAATTSTLPPTTTATTIATTAATEAATTTPSTAKPVATTRKTATTAKKKVATTAAPKPATTAKPKPTTTAVKPTTTAAPPETTTTPAATTTVVSAVVYSQAQSEAVIRKVWPDDLEAQAVTIAIRESNLRNTAHNYCCYGLFQINFKPHQQWLAALGVTKPEQLYDPTVNAQVAYNLYLKAGWAPWGG